MRTRMIRSLAGVLLILASLIGSGAGLIPAAAAPPAASPAAAPDTGCTMNFSDVQPGNLFYSYVEYLYCSGVVGGYPDGTFRPNNATTRGQLAKMISLAMKWPTNYSGPPHFADVPAGSVF